MKSSRLQEMIGEIFSDETIRKQFLTDPRSLISQFSLTAQEKTAVLATYDRLGLAGSDSTQLEAVIDPMEDWW
jgi:hypothetical protein